MQVFAPQCFIATALEKKESKQGEDSARNSDAIRGVSETSKDETALFTAVLNSFPNWKEF